MPKRARKSLCIVRLHKHARVLIDDLRRCADGRRYQRQAREHRFDEGNPKGLRPDVRLTMDVCLREEVRDVGPLPQEAHSVSDPEMSSRLLQRGQVRLLVRTLRSARYPRHPVGYVDHPPEGAQKQLVTLPSLQPAGLDDDDRVVRRAEGGAYRAAAAIGGVRAPRHHGIANEHATGSREEGLQSPLGCPAVRDDEVGRHAARKPLEPVSLCVHTMRPEDQGNAPLPYYFGKQGMWPGLVANHDVRSLLLQQRAQASSRQPNRPITTDAGVAERLRGDPGGSELCAQAPFEAQAEERRHLRAEIATPRERREHRLRPHHTVCPPTGGARASEGTTLTPALSTGQPSHALPTSPRSNTISPRREPPPTLPTPPPRSSSASSAQTPSSRPDRPE